MAWDLWVGNMGWSQGIIFLQFGKPDSSYSVLHIAWLTYSNRGQQTAQKLSPQAGPLS